jgi:hypothetical protein
VLIAKKADELTSQALQYGDAPDEASVDRLSRLAALADVYDRARRRHLKWRLPVIYTAFGVLLVVGALQWEIPRAEVELASQVSSVSFTLPQAEDIFDNLRLASFDVTDVACVTFAPAAHAECAAQNPSQIRIVVPSEASNHALVTIQQLRVPAGGRVTLSKPTSRTVCRISIESPHGEPIYIALSMHSVDVTTVVGTRAIKRHLEASNPPSVLELEVASPTVLEAVGYAGSEVAVQRDIRVTDLSFTDQVQTKDIGGEAVRPMSSILSGALYLDSLNGKRVDLRPFDNLRFTHSEGRLRTLALAPSSNSRLALDFHGFVEGMRGGTQEAGRSLMPSILQYVAAQSGLALYWGTVVFLFGLFMSIGRLWRSEP